MLLLWWYSTLFWMLASSSFFASANEVCGAGEINYGRYGLGDIKSELSLTLVASTNSASSISYKAVSAGGQQSLMLSNTGLVYSSGFNNNGGLGLGDDTDRWTPTWITAGGLSSVSIIAISAGWSNPLLLSNTGLVYSTGYNGYGGLGLGDTTDRWTPTMITAGGLSSVSIIAISAGYTHSLMLSNSGLVYAAGWNKFGQLGLGHTSERCTPTLITAGGLSSVSIIAISTGIYHSMMLSNTGFVYSTGYSGYIGRLGLNGTTDRWTPTLITTGGLSSVSIIAIAAGELQSLFLSNSSVVYGTGIIGMSPSGDTMLRTTPTLITAGGLSTVSITAIAAGGKQSFLLSNNSLAYAFGDNYFGQLGLGDTTDRWTPTLISSSISITAISTKGCYSLFLANQGCQIVNPSRNYLYLIGVVAAVVVVVSGVVVAVVFWRRRQTRRTVTNLSQPQSISSNLMDSQL